MVEVSIIVRLTEGNRALFIFVTDSASPLFLFPDLYAAIAFLSPAKHVCQSL
jgi:hypothetical protein